MTPVVRISDDIWDRLKQWAIPLEDKPDDVLRRVLDLAEEHKICEGRITLEQSSGHDNVKEVVKTERLPKGRKTPQEFYESPILEALYEVGGRARMDEVLKSVEERVRNSLRDVDYDPLKSGEPRWRNTAAWARFELVKRGLLKKDAGWGMWELTLEGRDFVAGGNT